ncbi:MAG: bifunctional 2',3'-cyclic-nucleotide 2'-phosphodiesterase/3'-nucleotidase [Pseudomonadota bacterium]
MSETRTPWPHSSAPKDSVWLRLLGTTDVHAHLMPYDYGSDAPVDDYGLAKTATLIRQARSEADHSMLFDNGDFLQGSSLSDLTAMSEAYEQEKHPVIRAMNELGYDAATLGNHEFNFGLGYLAKSLCDAEFPIISANALTEVHDDPTQDKTLIEPFTILEFVANDAVKPIRIGVLGLLPPQITTWDHTHLQGRVFSRDIVQTAEARVPQMRAAGADIIVVLAHTGFETDVYLEGDENAARALAKVPGIDAIFAGHTHDVIAHKIEGVPIVMAGFRGSHLGVIDLCITGDTNGWRVIEHHVETRGVKSADGKSIVADQALCRVVDRAHADTRTITAEPLCEVTEPVFSYLAQIRCDPILQPIHEAQIENLRRALLKTEFTNLPILSAAAPFKTGGNGGAEYYTDVPAGAISLRHAADIYPFPNTLVGVLVTGAELLDWLERTASCFHQILPNETCQILWNADFAGHAFDTLHGLQYEIDLSRPPRYDAKGTLINTATQRIRKVRFEDRSIDPEMKFAVATNNFRAFGGGQYDRVSSINVIHSGDRHIRDLLCEHLRSNGWQPHTKKSFRFTPISGASVRFETGPKMRNHRTKLSAMGAIDHGETETGFALFEIPMEAL